MRHRPGIAPDRQPEECFGPRLMAHVLGPSKQGGADVGAVVVGQGAKPERRPIADFRVGVAREPDQGDARVRRLGLWAYRCDS
jgi:endonuclease YncB( thermonuclease family)